MGGVDRRREQEHVSYDALLIGHELYTHLTT
jgi:hypothetical protein